MNTREIISSIQEKFGTDVLNVSVKNDRRVTIAIHPAKLTEMAEYLHRTLGLRFIIASALHSRSGFEIYYHFSHDVIGLILNLHVILPQENPEIESLSNMFDASNWIEREMHELFGIQFKNHPNLEKLVSEGNWAEGVYPYRKKFE